MVVLKSSICNQFLGVLNTSYLFNYALFIYLLLNLFICTYLFIYLINKLLFIIYSFLH